MNMAVFHWPERVVLSGIGIFDDSSLIAGTPFGFWICCEGDLLNRCSGGYNGSMYIGALGLTKQVCNIDDNGLIEIANGIYRITVGALDGTIAATLQSTDEPRTGPENVVTVSFTTPDIGTGTSTAAVVDLFRRTELAQMV